MLFVNAGKRESTLRCSVFVAASSLIPSLRTKRWQRVRRKDTLYGRAATEQSVVTRLIYSSRYTMIHAVGGENI
jgi:hypothetical protein